MEIIAEILSQGFDVSFRMINAETIEIEVSKEWEDKVKLQTSKRIGNLELDAAIAPVQLLRYKTREAFTEFKNGAKMIGKEVKEND